VAEAGGTERKRMLHARTMMIRGQRVTADRPPFTAIELGDGIQVFAVPVGKRFHLTVVFDQRSSLGLVRLRAAKAVEELERLLAEPASPFTPRGGSGGSGGNPAEMFDDVRRLRRKPPGN
jgi:hypothetical protein